MTPRSSPRSSDELTKLNGVSSTNHQGGQWKIAVIVGGMISLSILAGAWLMKGEPSVPDEIISAEISPTQKDSDPSPNGTSSSEQDDPTDKIPEPPAVVPSVPQLPAEPVPVSPLQVSQPVLQTGQPVTIPQKDAEGNYVNLQNWTSWRITTGQLNCRQAPSINSTLVSTLLSGVSISGTSIQLSEEGKPWLRINSANGMCFVRANDKYIAPVSAGTAGISGGASSQPVAQQDTDGNYLIWQNQTTWRVVTGQLNCRKSPSANAGVLSTVLENAVIRVDSSGGNPLQMSRDRKPWLKVRGTRGSCFVRARSSYIVPQS